MSCQQVSPGVVSSHTCGWKGLSEHRQLQRCTASPTATCMHACRGRTWARRLGQRRRRSLAPCAGRLPDRPGVPPLQPGPHRSGGGDAGRHAKRVAPLPHPRPSQRRSARRVAVAGVTAWSRAWCSPPPHMPHARKRGSFQGSVQESGQPGCEMKSLWLGRNF